MSLHQALPSFVGLHTVRSLPCVPSPPPNHSRNLGISRAPLKIQAHQGTSLFTKLQRMKGIVQRDYIAECFRLGEGRPTQAIGVTSTEAKGDSTIYSHTR